MGFRKSLKVAFKKLFSCFGEKDIEENVWEKDIEGNVWDVVDVDIEEGGYFQWEK